MVSCRCCFVVIYVKFFMICLIIFRLVVVALTSAVKCQDPSEFDVGTIYLSGFDASIHEIIQSFVLGQLDAPPGG